MFGYFVIPFFAVGLILGLVGILLFLYVFSKRTLRNFLLTRYNVDLGLPILTANDLFITPSILNYFGIVLFGLFFLFTFFVLSVMKDNMLEKQSFFNLLIYMTMYLLVYPIVMVISIKNILFRKISWGR